MQVFSGNRKFNEANKFPAFSNDVLCFRMEKSLVDIFKGLHESYKNLESRMKAEGFKFRVLKVCRAWEEWAVYPHEFLMKLQNIFLGLPVVSFFKILL